MTISHVIYLEFARLIVSWQWVTEVPQSLVIRMALEPSDQNWAKNAKYGNFYIFPWKIGIKSEENRDGSDDVGALFTWSVHTS